jgi:hypothetical protein
MSPPADDGALIITFPRAWTAAQRLEFMADVARAVPRERWAHVREWMGTDSIDATAAERRAVFARLAAGAPARWTSRTWPSSCGRDESRSWRHRCRFDARAASLGKHPAVTIRTNTSGVSSILVPA